MLALADFYKTGKPEQGCWPKVLILADRARLSRRQTQKILRKLEEDGELKVIPAGVLHKTQTYFLRVPIGGRTFNAPEVARRGVTQFTPGVSPSSPQGCRPVQSRGVADDTRTRIEPEVNQNRTLKGVAEEELQRPTTENPDGGETQLGPNLETQRQLRTMFPGLPDPWTEQADDDPAGDHPCDDKPVERGLAGREYVEAKARTQAGPAPEPAGASC
jgi:hypothetical protein